MKYEDFIASKTKHIEPCGFEVEERELNGSLFDWQRRIVRWGLRRGRAALFEDTGLGKTLQQLAWAEAVYRHTKTPVVIHTPVGVRHQTKREAAKFGIGCSVEVVDESDAVVDGINLVNYEKMHKFSDVLWGGVVLDESSILKGLNSKTRNELCERYRGLRFRLACTATPAPNDHMELGNHAEFLGVCESVDMLNRYFYHDSGDTSRWVLMPHGEKDFWRWVSQWAVCIGKPSDIGGIDDGYVLPELRTHRYFVRPEEEQAIPGFLFNVSGLSATTVHEEKRLTCKARCDKAAELVRAGKGPCIVWCDTNYESDMLMELIPNAVEVRGDQKDSVKESRLAGFANGEFEILLTKGSIAGMGLNFQHCRRMVFAGLSYSFESYYQSVRRCWRFGQTQPVDVHIILAETESVINSTIARKESDFEAMRCGMADAMKECTLEEFGLREGKRSYVATGKFSLPGFLKGAG
jgi:hypothetical protein